MKAKFQTINVTFHPSFNQDTPLPERRCWVNGRENKDRCTSLILLLQKLRDRHSTDIVFESTPGGALSVTATCG